VSRRGLEATWICTAPQWHEPVSMALSPFVRPNG